MWWESVEERQFCVNHWNYTPSSLQWLFGEKWALWSEWRRQIGCCSLHVGPVSWCAERALLWSVLHSCRVRWGHCWRSGGAAGRENKAGSGTPWRKEGLSPRKQLIELNSACCFSSVQQFLCHGKQKIVILICFTVWFVISIEFVLQRSVGKGREI